MHGLAAVDGFGEGLVDQLAHLLGADGGLAGLLGGFRLARYVGGAVAGVEDRVDGLLDGFGVLIQICGVAKDHGGGEDRAQGVGLAGARNVRGLSVDGLVEVDCAADGG